MLLPGQPVLHGPYGDPLTDELRRGPRYQTPLSPYARATRQAWYQRRVLCYAELGYDLSSLRVLGSVGEPINPSFSSCSSLFPLLFSSSGSLLFVCFVLFCEIKRVREQPKALYQRYRLYCVPQEAWKWYHSVIGNKQCPIVDTWCTILLRAQYKLPGTEQRVAWYRAIRRAQWQTETGGHMITSLPGRLIPFQRRPIALAGTEPGWYCNVGPYYLPVLTCAGPCRLLSTTMCRFIRALVLTRGYGATRSYSPEAWSVRYLPTRISMSSRVSSFACVLSCDTTSVLSCCVAFWDQGKCDAVLGTNYGYGALRTGIQLLARPRTLSLAWSPPSSTVSEVMFAMCPVMFAIPSLVGIMPLFVGVMSLFVGVMPLFMAATLTLRWQRGQGARGRVRGLPGTAITLRSCYAKFVRYWHMGCCCAAAVCLRACYAKSGTDTACDTGVQTLVAGSAAWSVWRPGPKSAMGLRACYDISSTEVLYGPTRVLQDV
eukprot:3941948-Rhodomonas_salina.2